MHILKPGITWAPDSKSFAFSAKSGNSDALFNLGYALGSLSLLENGVYVAMNGRTLLWNDVVKNRSLGIFQSPNS